eukprot:TRINITY_DN12694_c0_g4_i1.p1 TRINITY_DN12694_c0_g4~~TRINITY_DN12694_c0_g4_i1.p1  ORF type:complete len:1294 (+),score=165.55 TRINITY_DN12694_c0_g4_i1:38-3919(+)
MLGPQPPLQAKARQKCTKENPWETVSIFSRETFTFLGDLLSVGYKRPLVVDDMYATLKEDDSALLVKNLGDNWLKEVKKNPKNPSLFLAIMKTFKREYFIAIMIGVLEWTAGLIEPYFVSKLIVILSEEDDSPADSVDDGELWMYAGLFMFASLCRAYFHHPMFYRTMHTGMRVRIACVGLTFDKLLKLSNDSLAKTTTGHLVNLVSNDAETFDQAFIFGAFLLIGPIKLIVGAYLLYQQMEYASFAGIAFCILLAPIQYYSGQAYSKFRQKSTVLTDLRVKLMNEIIMGVRLIKMYAWEGAMGKAVLDVRKAEEAKKRLTSNLRAANAAFFFCATPLIMFVMISIYVHYSDDELTPEKVFACVMYLNVIRLSVSLFIPEAIKNGAEALVSISRIQTFLLFDEFKPLKQITDSSTPHVKLENVTATWPLGSSKKTKKAPLTLSNVSLTASAPELVGVTGAVGSGKSSIFAAILGELPATTGQVTVSGNVTVAQQEVWIASDTVRANILFGREFDAERYAVVVDACCLESDFSQFQDGDNTVIGERGITLSGGQRARISLARACYQGGDIFLLDDPLSAVDTIVGRKIFDKCINTLLKGKLRILITHQHQFIPQCDRAFEVKDSELEEVNPSVFLLSSSSSSTSSDEDEIEEAQSDHHPETDGSKDDSKAPDATKPKVEMILQEDRSVGAVSLQSYVSYFKHGGVIKSTIFFFLAALSQGIFALTDFWLSEWTDRDIHDKDDSYHYRYYSIGIAVLVVLGIIRSVLFFRLAITAATGLHGKMFLAVLHSPVSFFDSNPSGRVLNRFSKDLGQLDELLPWIFFDTIQNSLLCLGGIVTVSVVNPWVLVVVGPLLAVFVWMRRYFVATAREVKRLEAMNRSPLYTAFSEAVSGLHTIRAYDRSTFFKDRYRAIQNDHSSSWYMFLLCNRWIGLRLDIMSWAFISSVTIAAIIAKDSLSPGQVALSLAYASSLAGSFQWCVRQSAETENHMTATERIRTYGKLPPEESKKLVKRAIKPPKNWPDQGKIEFKDYSLKYREGLPTVLNKLNFTISPGSKVGIVGRTGAGKSSIMQGLFRLVEAANGSILVDNVNTSTVRLKKLRSSCSVIPQDPILFSGTVRYNLDPFNRQKNDQTLWKALEAVQLKNAVKKCGGLSFAVSEGGRNFSIGQRQLICLARAILQKNKILMMDEATANVDPETDSIIQETIRNQFKACTVITVAHRLHTIIDNDLVVVLHKGVVSDIGEPHELLQREDSLLTKFVNQTGAASSRSLRETARQASLRRLNSASLPSYKNVPY